MDQHSNHHHHHHHHGDHSEDHFSGSAFLRDVVIGMADGLTVPFALAAGLSGAISNNSIIITAGIAEIAAGSIAMGLGGYLAGRTEVNHYDAELQREYFEVERYPEVEMQEVRDVFAEMGLSETSQNLIADELSKDKEKWVQFMMRYELGLEEPNPNQATKSALTIGISYIIGGLLPLAPYFFIEGIDALKTSVIITLIALFIFGYFKSKAIGQPAVTGAFKVMFIGAVAAGAAYGIAKWIS